MANFSALETLIPQMFSVLDLLVDGMVNLITGNLLVLAIVGAFVGVIIAIIYLLLNYIRKTFNSSITMKGK